MALLPTFTDTAWFHDYASHATIELLRGRLQFANRTDKGYTPFGHGIFVFRKKSARVDNRLAISLDGHRIGTSSPRDVAARAEPSKNRGGVRDRRDAMGMKSISIDREPTCLAMLAQRVQPERALNELALAAD